MALTSKVRLKFNPYTYIRVLVMRTLLLAKEDYQRLMKMTFAEQAQDLAKTTYRKQIDELGLKYTGAELIERAVDKNLVETFQKIKRMGDEPLRMTLDIYFLRDDIHNIKAILRGRASALSPDAIKETLLPSGVLSTHQLDELMKLPQPRDVIMESNIFANEFVEELFLAHPSPEQIENALDKEYFSQVYQLTKRMGGQGKLFARFLGNEIDILNIITVVRGVLLGISPAEQKRMLISHGALLDQKTLEGAMHAKNLESVLKAFHATQYGVILSRFAKNPESLTFLKATLLRESLRDSLRLMHQNLLTVDAILAFVLSKQIEAKNIKTMIKGKQLGIDPEIVEKELVY